MTSVIDLTKSARRTGKKALNAVMSVAEWNSANPTHPRGPDGEFMDAMGKGHQAMADLLHGMVHEHGGEDTPLGRALLGRIGRESAIGGSEPGKSTSESLFGSDPLPGTHEWRKRQEAGAVSGGQHGFPAGKYSDDVARIMSSDDTPEKKAERLRSIASNASGVANMRLANSPGHRPGDDVRIASAKDDLMRAKALEEIAGSLVSKPGAKPLTVSKPATGKGLAPSAVTRLQAMRGLMRPMDSDTRELEGMVSGMTIAQLHEAAEHLGNPHASKSYKKKADIQQGVVGILRSRQAWNAIVGGPEHEKAKTREAKARENALAIQGTSKEGKTLFEMTDAEREAHFEAERAGGESDADLSSYVGGTGSMAAKRQAREALEQERVKRDQGLKDLASLSPDQLSERLRQNTIKRQNPDTPQAERNDLIVEHSELQRLMGVKVTTTKPVKARTPDPKETGKYSSPVASTRTLDAMVADPQSGDREGMHALLSGKGMTISAIESFYQGKTGHKIPSIYRTKQDKINHAVEHLVGSKLNSKALAGTDWLTGETRGPAGAIAGGRRLSGNPRATNTWGGERDKDAIHYHADGEIGWAADRLGEDTNLEVQGDSLVNRLDRIASDTVAGKTTPAQQIEELRKLHGALPEGPGKRAVGSAIRNLDAPVKKAPVTVPAGAPEPIKDFVTDLAKIPLMSQGESSMGGRQASGLWAAVQEAVDEIKSRQEAGRNLKVYLRSMGYDLMPHVPHESLEGAAQIRALVNKLMRQLEA